MIDLSLLLSVCSLGVSAFLGISNLSRNKNKDTKSSAVELTTVLIKLENIESKVSDINKNISYLQETVKSDKEELIRMEERVKPLFNRGNI